MSSARPSPDVITLHDDFSHCRPGTEVRDVSAKEGTEGWVIWGHYACLTCDKVALRVTATLPHAVKINGRMLPVITSTI